MMGRVIHEALIHVRLENYLHTDERIFSHIAEKYCKPNAELAQNCCSLNILSLLYNMHHLY